MWSGAAGGAEELPSVWVRIGSGPVTVGALALRRAIPRLRLRFASWSPQAAGLLIVLLGSAAAHGINMGNFPYYENDEGIYVSQAWAVVHQGTLAPYTYFYDHAPLGWLQMAVWSVLSGGFYALGTSIETGRGFMFVIQVVSTGLVYFIARRLTGSTVLAIGASAAYAFSAYGIYYHRRVLLDNIAAVWMLASLAILLRERLTLTWVWLAAGALGISILSKELTVFVVPAMALLVFVRVHRAVRWMAVVGWLVIVGSIVSGYVLMAGLKGELLPDATPAGETAAHVSLLGTLSEQAARGKDGGLLESGSQFWLVAAEWASQEPLLIVGGTVTAALAVLLMPWRREAGAIGLMTFSLWLFIGRGGVVLPFYAVPLLPLFALNLVAASDAVRVGARWVIRRGVGRPSIPERGLLVGMAVALVLGVSPGYVRAEGGFSRDPLVLWRSTEAVAQRDALHWVRDHLPANAAIAIDRYLWTDLQAPPTGEPSYTLAHDYRKIDADPYIRINVFEEDWRNFDYLVFSGQFVHDMQADDLDFLQQIHDQSTRVATFDTGGWPIYVHRVFHEDVMAASDDPLLAGMWADYVDRFIEADGRVVDPARADRGSTSEGQAYAMLRAVYVDDRETFDRAWSWTQAHLQRSDGLLSWSWGGDRRDVIDASSAPDADIDAALALVFASRVWSEPEYANDAAAMLKGIWEGVTVEVAGERILVAGDWAQGDRRPVVNPSYFAPYAFRIFAEVDPGRDWRVLIDSSYSILERWAAGDGLGAPVGTLPNWMSVDRITGELGSAIGRVRSADEFSYDASRVLFRLSLDWLWFAEPRAIEAMQAVGLPLRELREKGRLLAAYGLDGAPVATHEAGSMYAGTLPVLLLAGERDLAVTIHSERILGPALDERSDDRDSYYAQNWAWFATALIDGGLSNLWAGESTAPWRVQP
jgi:endo-1,4-beta-D-glucanase Y